MKFFYIEIDGLSEGRQLPMRSTNDPKEVWQEGRIYCGSISDSGIEEPAGGGDVPVLSDGLTADMIGPGILVPLPDVDGIPQPIINVDHVDFVTPDDQGATAIHFAGGNELRVAMPFRAAREALCGEQAEETSK